MPVRDDLPVPHMGWSQLSTLGDDPILEGVAGRRLRLFRPLPSSVRTAPATHRPRRLWSVGSGRGARGQPLGLPVPPRAVGRDRRAHPEELPGARRVIVYPAIDLRDGVCVRLMHGRFDQVTEYDQVPAARLAAFAAEGATWVHIVDLDGAEAGKARAARTDRRAGAAAWPSTSSRAAACAPPTDVERLLDAGVSAGRGRIAGGDAAGRGLGLAGPVRPRPADPGLRRAGRRGRRAGAVAEGLDRGGGRRPVDRAGSLSGRDAAAMC